MKALTISISETLLVMQGLAAITLVLQTIEFFQIRASFGASGIWSWEVLRREFPGPLRSIFGFFLGNRAFLFLLVLRLGAVIFSVVFDNGILWFFLWFSTLLIAFRWRGTFNGGSDSMMLIVLASLTIAGLFDDIHPAVTMVCLGYVAIQTCLSFFIAGVVKARKPKWRSGEALRGFLASDYYAVPIRIRDALNGREGLIRLSSWVVIAFECLFPVALVHPSVCLWMIGCALFFQSANAFVLGLNRFVWAWAAAYPALYWCSAYLYEHR